MALRRTDMGRSPGRGQKWARAILQGILESWTPGVWSRVWHRIMVVGTTPWLCRILPPERGMARGGLKWDPLKCRAYGRGQLPGLRMVSVLPP